MVTRASKMSAVNGLYTWFTGHKLLDHTAMNMRKQPAWLAFIRFVSGGSFPGGSDGDRAQRASWPETPKNWQQPFRQGGQKDLSTSQLSLFPKMSAGRASPQTLCVETLRNPPQITTFIKQEEQIATGLTERPDPEAGLTSFCASMEGLLSRPGLHMNYIHFSAITSAAAHVWTEAQRSPRFIGQADVHERLEGLYQRCLQSLKPLLADMGAQAVSNVLWSSATLSFDPDDAVPGMVHALTVRFLHFVDAVQDKQRPNAQEIANVLWAFATMRHPAATAQVVGAICLQFGRLTQHSDAEQCPTGQNCANALWALGKLKHTPCDNRLLDWLCDHMRGLLCSYDQRARPNIQAVANTMWGLAQLKHAPSHDVVAAMFDRLVALCQTPGLQLNSQAISISLYSCAELRLGMRPTCVETLLKHFMNMHISSVDYQHYSNAAWSLAGMQCLDLNTFEGLLDKLITKHTLSVQQSGTQSSSAQLNTADARQLHQALAWLMPPSGSEQLAAWSSLRSRLQAVAPEPTASKLFLPGQAELGSALELQGLAFKAEVPCGTYRAHAVLSPNSRDAADVILMLQRPGDCINNVPSRVLGHVAFRNQLLARYGTVVTILFNPDSSTVKSMADDIKAAVEAKTVLPLDIFRS